MVACNELCPRTLTCASLPPWVDSLPYIGALASSIVTEKPNVKWDDVAGLDAAKEVRSVGAFLAVPCPCVCAFIGAAKKEGCPVPVSRCCRIDWLPAPLHEISFGRHPTLISAGAEGGGHFAGEIPAALPGACLPNVTGSVSVCVPMRKPFCGSKGIGPGSCVYHTDHRMPALNQPQPIWPDRPPIMACSQAYQAIQTQPTTTLGEAQALAGHPAVRPPRDGQVVFGQGGGHGGGLQVLLGVVVRYVYPLCWLQLIGCGGRVC